MKEQIDAILAEATAEGFEVGYELIDGSMWQMWVGNHGGGREKNGIALARKLVDDALAEKRVLAAKRAARPDVNVLPSRPIPVPPQPLTTPQADELAKLRARIAELEAEKLKPADDIAVPEFLKEPIPHDLTDLIDPVDTPVQSNEKLLARLREVLGLIGLAEDAGGRAAPELYRKRDRLESGIRFNRGRMAETL